MGLFDNLVNAFLKLTDPTPKFTASRCLLEKNSVGGCDRCQQVCPHGAIRLENFTVEIDEALCTGCGLCTQVCPGVALEFPLGPVQESFYRGRGQIRCSKVAGSGEEVLCLGRLTPGVLAEAASRKGPLTLAHGDCVHCKIGGPDVLRRLQETVEEGKKYYPGLEVNLTMEPLRGAAVGRREMFGALLGSAKRSAAELVPNIPFIQIEEEPTGLPAELRLRELAAKRAPAEAPLRWPKIAVAEGCTLCPVCTNVCPTGAVERIREGVEGLSEEYVLKLNVSACTGCGACVSSCPPQVITLEEAGPAEIFGEPLELYRGRPPWYDL